MKHKAQESLKSKCNVCEEMARITHRGGCAFRNIDNTRCKEYDTLQDLINCQLTVEELDELLLTLGLKIHDMDYLQIRNDRFYLLNKIIEKVKKQKEMWVSENVFK